MKEILSGNEAIARGAFEAGCLVACAYPGTPSTEILENALSYKEINSSWAPMKRWRWRLPSAPLSAAAEHSAP